MPRIFDNIDIKLLPALRKTLEVSERADFSIGYLNLRGWKSLDSLVEKWEGGEGHCCRLLVGMQRPPEQDLRELMSLSKTENGIDNATVVRFRQKLAADLREQLLVGAPNNEDEAELRRLAALLTTREALDYCKLHWPE